MGRLRVFSAFSAGLILSGLLQGCMDYPGSATKDTKITANVQRAITGHPELGPPNQIYVDTRDGVVYLSGLVDDSLLGENAKTVAGNVPGVRRVESSLSVDK